MTILDSYLHAVMLAVATLRLTRLVIEDEITESLRESIWKKYGDPSESKLGYAITCYWCTSIYAATAMMTLYSISKNLGIYVAAILCFSYVTGFVSNRVS